MDDRSLGFGSVHTHLPTWTYQGHVNRQTFSRKINQLLDSPYGHLGVQHLAEGYLNNAVFQFPGFQVGLKPETLQPPDSLWKIFNLIPSVKRRGWFKSETLLSSTFLHGLLKPTPPPLSWSSDSIFADLLSSCQEVELLVGLAEPGLTACHSSLSSS